MNALATLLGNIDYEEIMDSFLVNETTKMGTSDDWTQKTSPRGIRRFSRCQLDNLSLEPSLNNICRALPESAVLKGWEYNLGQSGDANQEQNINDYGRLLDIQGMFNEGQYLANVYGGAAAILIVEDGRRADQPLDKDKIMTIRGWRVLDKYQIRPEHQSFGNPKDAQRYELTLPQYLTENMPERDRRKFARGYYIHASRVIRFDGYRCTPEILRCNNGWGISLIEAIYDKFSRYETSLHSVAGMIKDASLFIIKMKGWADFARQRKKESLKSVTAELMLMQMTATIFGGVTIDRDEHDIEFLERKFYEHFKKFLTNLLNPYL